MNACKRGISGFLEQNRHVICCEYKKITEHKKKYATHDLELVVIAHTLNMWRHYLMGRKNEIRIYHIGM